MEIGNDNEKSWKDTGREFDNAGPDTVKLRSPYLFVLVLELSIDHVPLNIDEGWKSTPFRLTEWQLTFASLLFRSKPNELFCQH